MSTEKACKEKSKLGGSNGSVCDSRYVCNMETVRYLQGPMAWKLVESKDTYVCMYVHIYTHKVTVEEGLTIYIRCTLTLLSLMTELDLLQLMAPWG